MFKKKHHVIIVSLVVGITIALLVSPVLAANKTELNKQKQEAQKQKSVTEYKINQTQTTVNGIKNELKKADAKIAELDVQIAQSNETIKDYNNQIAKKEQDIRTLKAQIANKQQQNDDRLRSMYMYGVEDYSTALFTSQTFSELINRIQMIKAVAQADKNVIASMNASQQSLNQQKAQLTTIKNNLSLTKQKQENAKTEQANIREQQNQLLSKNTALIKAYKADVEKQDAKIAAADSQLAEIAKKEAADAAKEQVAKQSAATKPKAATNNNKNNSKSYYIWPVSSRRITSTFGGRKSPGGIGSTNHQGIDIGAASGSPIHAIASGKVILAGWNGGYGNCVMISHGNGVVSVYGHQSKLAVSSGQTIKQGDVIGYVGSTGHSTGPHLHLGILKNGSYVNPLNGYVKP